VLWDFGAKTEEQSMLPYPKLIVAAILCTILSLPAKAQAEFGSDGTQLSAEQLVVMVDGRFPTTGQLTEGAGVIVGRRGGLVYIVTAGHVVQGFTEAATDITIQFRDRPGEEVEATLWPSNLDRGIDLAILVVPEDRAPDAITSVEQLSVARLSRELAEGEGVYFLGQPSGRVWDGNRQAERVVSSTTTVIEVVSTTVVPGMSGGATLDEDFQIVGIIIETENGLARAIPLRLVQETLERVGYPFSLIERETGLLGEGGGSVDPMSQLASWGYPLGMFESGQALFLRALQDQRSEVAAMALRANVSLSSELLLSHTFPRELLPLLMAHRNWDNGRDVCRLVSERSVSPYELERRAPENYRNLQAECPPEVSAIERLEEEERAAADEAARRQEALEREQNRIAAEQRAREAAERQRVIDDQQAALERNRVACLAYYASPLFLRNVRETLVRFILNNGEYWHGMPDYSVPDADADLIFMRNEYIQNVDWLLGYTAANFGVLNNQLAMRRPSTPESRFQTVDEAIAGNLRDYGELRCNQLRIRG
jgi:hypothetical protein